LKEVVISGFSLSTDRREGTGASVSMSLNFEEFEYGVHQGDASHRVSYHINKYTTLLNGEEVPSTYVTPEGEDDY